MAGAAVVGLVIWGVGAVLDVPSVGLFALFGAAASVVPYLGILVGWLPVVIVGIGVAPAWQVGLVALVAVGLQYLEATRWRPFVDGRSLYVGPALPIVGAVLGYADLRRRRDDRDRHPADLRPGRRRRSSDRRCRR